MRWKTEAGIRTVGGEQKMERGGWEWNGEEVQTGGTENGMEGDGRWKEVQDDGAWRLMDGMEVEMELDGGEWRRKGGG